jgi:hypothetical protein
MNNQFKHFNDGNIGKITRMTHEDYENQVSAISVKPKKTWNAPIPGAPRGVAPKHVVPNWVNNPAKPVPGSVPPVKPDFTQEYEAKYNKPPAGIPVEDDPNKGTGDTNYCVTDIISVCSCPMVRKNWTEQKICKFAYKASNAERCMYFVQEQFCDNLAAQKDAAPKSKTLTDCMGL